MEATSPQRAHRKRKCEVCRELVTVETGRSYAGVYCSRECYDKADMDIIRDNRQMRKNRGVRTQAAP
jgi:hypothetical protein